MDFDIATFLRSCAGVVRTIGIKPELKQLHPAVYEFAIYEVGSPSKEAKVVASWYEREGMINFSCSWTIAKNRSKVQRTRIEAMNAMRPRISHVRIVSDSVSTTEATVYVMPLLANNDDAALRALLRESIERLVAESMRDAVALRA